MTDVDIVMTSVSARRDEDKLDNEEYSCNPASTVIFNAAVAIPGLVSKILCETGESLPRCC